MKLIDDTKIKLKAVSEKMKTWLAQGQNKKRTVLGLSLALTLVLSATVYTKFFSHTPKSAVSQHKKEKAHEAPKVEAKEEADEELDESTEVAENLEIKPPKMGLFSKHGMFGRLIETYKQAWIRLNEKIETIDMAFEENRRLRLEAANLRLSLEGFQFDCQNRDAQKRTEKMASSALRETGAKVGRTLASINYRPPTHLLPAQLYTLGVSYFKAKEFEKSAVIFSFLAGLEDVDDYRDPKSLMLAGVSWYKLDHFEAAQGYFNKTLEFKPTNENLQSLAQARLWHGLVAHKLGDPDMAQKWVYELLDHHPHSPEAEWINSKNSGDQNARRSDVE